MEVDDEADSSNSNSSVASSRRDGHVAVRPPPKPRPPSPELEIASHSNSSATTTISAPYDYAPPQLPLSARTKTEETAKGCLHASAHRGHTHYNCVCSRPSSPRSAPEEDDSAPPPAHREHAPPHNVNIHQHHSSLPPMVNNQPPLVDSKPESGIIYIPVTQMVPVRVDEYGRILPASQLPSSYTYAYPPPLAAHAQIYGHGGYAPSRGGLHIGYAREYRHAPYARYVDESPPHEHHTERMELPPAIATAASHLDEAAQSSMTNLLPLPLPSLPIHNAMHSSFQPPFMDDHSITSSDAATAMSQSGGRIRNMDNTSSLSFAAPNVMNANFRPY